MGFLPGADYLCLSVDVDVAVCHAVVNPPSADCGAALLGLIIIKLMLVDSARGGIVQGHFVYRRSYPGVDCGLFFAITSQN